MYRRRLIQREKIAFGFDCFLDVVTNVIGIIVRLILVAWVAARSYTSLMEKQLGDAAPVQASSPALPPLPSLPEGPQPLNDRIAQTQSELDQARARLVAYLDQLRSAEETTLQKRRQVASLAQQGVDLEKHAQGLTTSVEVSRNKLELANFSLTALAKRSQELTEKIQRLEKEPPPTKPLRYRTPVSRVVDGEELMFECQAGRVSHIDLSGFLHEIRGLMTEAKVDEIAKAGRFSGATAPIGAFRLRYRFEADRGVFTAPGQVRIQLIGWVAEPDAIFRGENEEAALKEGSDFRRIVDGIDPNGVTVTFWVYPDSFALFRALRGLYLHEHGVEVAGRPLPAGQPIGASIHGTKSRGQ